MRIKNTLKKSIVFAWEASALPTELLLQNPYNSSVSTNILKSIETGKVIFLKRRLTVYSFLGIAKNQSIAATNSNRRVANAGW